MSEKVKAVDNGLDILNLLYRVGSPLGVSEISRELSLNKSTVHRILSTFEEKGFLYQHENGNYWLGMKIYVMGLSIGDRSVFGKIVKPYAKRLCQATQEGVNISVLDGSTKPYKSVVVFKEMHPDRVLTAAPPVGLALDAHASAVGKCLLAFSKNIKIESLTDDDLKKYTENTICTVSDLKKELHDVRSKGYAIDNEEREVGLYCIGSPIFDCNGDVMAAISVTSPASRILFMELDKLIDIVRKTGKEISDEFRHLRYSSQINPLTFNGD